LLDDEQVRLAAGSVVLVPRHSVHGFQFSGGAEGLVMTLAYPLLTRAGGELARQVMAMNAPQVCEPPALLQDDGIAALLPSLAIEFDARREHRGLILESLAVAALAEHGGFLHAPDVYMEKIAVGDLLELWILPHAESALNLPESFTQEGQGVTLVAPESAEKQVLWIKRLH
jgi:hypothetical protein